MIFAELPDGVTQGFEQFRDSWVLYPKYRIGFWPVMNAARLAMQLCWP